MCGGLRSKRTPTGSRQADAAVVLLGYRGGWRTRLRPLEAVVGYNSDHHGRKAYSVWDPAVGSLHTLAASDWNRVAWNYVGFGNFVIA